MSTLVRDFRVALRSDRRDPTAALLVVLTMGLGIGSATAVFTVVDAALLRTLPFMDAASSVLEAFLFDVEPTDPATYLWVAAFLVGIALSAVAVSPLRAARVEPQRRLAAE